MKWDSLEFGHNEKRIEYSFKNAFNLREEDRKEKKTEKQRYVVSFPQDIRNHYFSVIGPCVFGSKITLFWHQHDRLIYFVDSVRLQLVDFYN